MDGPTERVAARVAALMGSHSLEWRRVVGGYTPTARFVARFDFGTAFVKVATTKHTASLLRSEIAAYSALHAAFMPEQLASEDDADTPILILQDLSAASWPPPWSPERVERVLESIDALHSAHAGLPQIPDAPRVRHV